MSEQNERNLEASNHRRRRPHGFVAGLLLGLLAAGVAAAVAFGPGVDAASRWRQHRGPSGKAFIQNPERTKDHLAFAADWILDRVDATDAQKESASNALRQSVDRVLPLAQEHRANREEVVQLLSAPQIDRVAIEDLRQSQLILADRFSEELMQTALTLAETLTPEQRSELVTMAERFHH